MPQSDSLITVYSVDGSDYLAWQSELLRYSFERAGMYGRLVRLMSGTPTLSASQYQGETFRTEDFSDKTAIHYTPANKIGSLLAWSKTMPADETPVLVLDPDMIFIRPIDEQIVAAVSSGCPVAHPVAGWLNPDVPAWAAFTKRHCSAPSSSIDQIGVPLIITRADLAKICPLWWRKILEIKADTTPNGNNDHAKDRGGWEAEMWAFVFAAAELGISFSSVELCRFQQDSRLDLPLLHYAYTSEPTASSPSWSWKKASYHPWDQVEIPSDVPEATRFLLEELNEYASTRARMTAYQRPSVTGLLQVLSR